MILYVTCIIRITINFRLTISSTRKHWWMFNHGWCILKLIHYNITYSLHGGFMQHFNQWFKTLQCCNFAWFLFSKRLCGQIKNVTNEMNCVAILRKRLSRRINFLSSYDWTEYNYIFCCTCCISIKLVTHRIFNLHVETFQCLLGKTCLKFE